MIKIKNKQSSTLHLTKIMFCTVKLTGPNGQYMMDIINIMFKNNFVQSKNILQIMNY